MPTVSVIAAAHNQELHIHQAIQSVLNQSFQDIELIVTDDASNDGTLDIIRLFTGDARLRVLSNSTREGLALALTRSASVSTGKYLAWLDCNDVYETHHLETLTAFLEKNLSTIGVVGMASTIDENGESLDILSDAGVNKSRFELLNLLYKQTNPFCLSASLIRRESVVAVDYMSPEFSQYYERSFWTKLLLNGSLEMIPEMVARSRQINDEVTAALLNRSAFEIFELLNQFADQIVSKELLLQIFPEIANVKLPITDQLIQFHLALIALANESPSSKLFGLHKLHQLLKIPETAKLLKSDCGFSYHDLFDFEDDSNVFASGAVQLDLVELQEELENGSPALGKRLKTIDGLKVNYSNILRGWVATSEILLREGPHLANNIPFAFNWCNGPSCSLTLYSDLSGPHLFVLEVQNLLFPSMTLEVEVAGQKFTIPLNHKSGKKTDLFQAVLELGAGKHQVNLLSDRWQKDSLTDSRPLAFILKDIRLWECV